MNFDLPKDGVIMSTHNLKHAERNGAHHRPASRSTKMNEHEQAARNSMAVANSPRFQLGLAIMDLKYQIREALRSDFARLGRLFRRCVGR